jgi:hypothetical protein
VTQLSGLRLLMTEPSSPARFKADMPDIAGPPRRSPRGNPHLLLVLGFAIVGLGLFLAVRWLSHPRQPEPSRKPAPQIEVPAPAPDPNSLLPHADQSNPTIAEVSDLAKPWSSADFFVRNELTGENIPATIVRLPGGSATAVTGYWAFSRKAPYGDCRLEYVTDLAKLRTEYDYRRATHPLVGNPCSRTLYDPLRTVNLPGNIWIRGAIVQGSDIRPPLGVEIKIQGKQIQAIRSE